MFFHYYSEKSQAAPEAQSSDREARGESGATDQIKEKEVTTAPIEMVESKPEPAPINHVEKEPLV